MKDIIPPRPERECKTIDLKMLDKYGYCKATSADVGICDGCPLDFNYEGQYYGDTPYPACEVIKEIIQQAYRKVNSLPTKGRGT